MKIYPPVLISDPKVINFNGKFFPYCNLKFPENSPPTLISDPTVIDLHGKLAPPTLIADPLSIRNSRVG